MVFASSFQGIVCKSRGSQPIMPKIGYVRGIGSFELKIKYFDHPTNFDLPTTPISKLSRNFTKLENRSLSFHSKLDVSALQNFRNSKARKFCPRRYPKSPRSLSNSNSAKIRVVKVDSDEQDFELYSVSSRWILIPTGQL